MQIIMRPIIEILVPIITLILLVGCDDKLTREEAKEKIILGLKLPLDEVKSFKIDDNTYFADKTAKQYQLLKELGLLDYTFEGVYSSQYHAQAKLTGKRRKICSF